jgi:predicted DCC family thiol-disulfide oxidoreductase YuxK
MSLASPATTDASAPTASRRASGPFGEAWSGGQWSLVRVLLAAYLIGYFALRFDRGASLLSLQNGAVELGLVASLGLALGAQTRVMAALLIAVGGWLLTRGPFAPRPAAGAFLLPLVALLLAPQAPFGSIAARGRLDPDGGWRLPPKLFTLLWLGLTALSLLSAVGKLQSTGWREGSAVADVVRNGAAVVTPVQRALAEAPPWLLTSFSFFLLGAELLFGPLAFFRAARPFAWIALLLRHLVALPLAGLRDEHLAMATALLFLFDPAWLPPRRPARRETIYYDGTCGLCHRWVRFVLAEDRLALFALSPLQGTAIRSELSDAERAQLPDSVVVHDAEREVRVKSSGVALVGDRLGGWWRVGATLLRIVPRPLRDLGYDAVAGVRRRLFAQPADSCPIVPPALRERFLS